MGQQLPYLPNGQSPYGQQFPAAAQSLPIQLPALPGVPNAAGGMGPNPPGQIPGIDPRMLQQAQQSLANPNGGDVMGNLLPGPKELGMGAAIGVGTALAFNKLDDWKAFDKMAIGLDKITGSSKFAKQTDEWLAKKTGPRLREFTLADALVDPASIKGKTKEEIEKIHADATKKAVDNMERRQLEGTIEKFQKRVSGDKKASLRKAYDKMLTEMRDSGHMPGHGGHNFMEGKLPDTMRISGNPAYHAELTQFNTSMEDALKTAKKAAKEAGKGSIPIKVKNDPYRTYYNFINQTTHEDLKAKAIEEWKKIGAESKDLGLKSAEDFIHHQGAVDELTRQFRYLNGKEKLSKEEEKLRKELFHLKERLSGIKNLYTPLYESQAKLTAELSAQGVGPVGRTVRSFANYLQRIFRGDTMKMGGSKAGEAGQGFMAKMGSHLGPMFGPVMMGAFLFGFSFQSAKNAKEGEKKQAFFHNLLGQQIFNFIGWEFGRKVLNSVEFGKFVFRGLAGKTLPFLRRVPFLGAITLGGFGTEIAAMLVFGGLFQKVGEKISHAIFGKPSQASIDGKGNTPAAQTTPGQPGQPNQAPGQGQNQGQTQASNPALSGMFNPTLMNQAMQQPGLQPGLGASYGSAPGSAFPAINPGAAMGRPSVPPSLPATPPMGNPAGNPGGYGNPAMARTPQAPQPAAPVSSLSPTQISQSKVANDYNVYYNKLKSDKTLDKRPGELLDKM